MREALHCPERDCQPVKQKQEVYKMIPQWKIYPRSNHSSDLMI